MKVEYQDTLIVNGAEIKGDHKTISLPFTHISVRAIILRISDGAILGALHRPDGKYALPGGAIDDGEKAEDALIRELDEEKIHLIGSDENLDVKWIQQDEESWYPYNREKILLNLLQYVPNLVNF